MTELEREKKPEIDSSEQEIVQEDHDIAPDYDIETERVGRGGCAVVYEGWRKRDHFHVAIKVLAIPPTLDAQEIHVAKRRFYREAKLIASLHNEHIVECVDYGLYDGQPCMVLEFIQGQELGDYLEKHGRLSIEETIDIIVQVLDALASSHEKTIIHRDIKPGNIMVLDGIEENGLQIKVLDFGIATVLDSVDNSNTLMTQQGNVRGTPSYMAPELFTGAVRASVESDLYAVGLVLLECLTNQIAFVGDSFMQIAFKQVNEEPEIPSYIPPCLIEIIRKSVNKKNNDRYHSARDFIVDLESNLVRAVHDYPSCLQAYELEQAREPEAPSVFATLWNTRKPMLLAIAIAIVVIALLSVGLMAILHLKASERSASKAAQEKALEAEKNKAQFEEANKELSAEAERAREEQRIKVFVMGRDFAAEKLRDAWNQAAVSTDEFAKAEFDQAQKTAKAENESAGNDKASPKNEGAKPARKPTALHSDKKPGASKKKADHSVEAINDYTIYL